MKRNYSISRRDKQGLDPVRIPTSFDVAWAAGVYEGEGSCLASGVNGKSFNVQVSQKDPELLYRLKEMFGGSVLPYNNGGFLIHHWTCCGDRGRVFLASIYPFLTARRKAQIESTTAWRFLSGVEDLITPRDSSPCQTYAALWSRIHEHIESTKAKAREHKKLRHKEYHELKKFQDPTYLARRREQTRKWRKSKKEQQLAVSTNKIVEIA